MSDDKKLNYIEFQTRDLAASKRFFEQVFGWEFTDYGPSYAAFAKAEAGLDGGFETGEPNQGALVVFYGAALETVQSEVEAAGGVIVQAIFDFPGGRRFQFREPGGNELAVWSEPA